MLTPLRKVLCVWGGGGGGERGWGGGGGGGQKRKWQSCPPPKKKIVPILCNADTDSYSWCVEFHFRREKRDRMACENWEITDEFLHPCRQIKLSPFRIYVYSL